MLTVGLVQADVITHDKRGNFLRYEALLSRELHERIDLLVFPEMFSCGFSQNVASDAESEDGESVAFLKHISMKYVCDTVATVPITENGLLYNRLFWISHGEIIGSYDKHHLFIGEEMFFSSGEEKTIVNTLGYNFLPLVCFEVRFPEWCRNSVKNEAFEYDCSLFLSNFPAPREQELLTLARARAIENQAFVIVTNRVGTDGNNNRYSGGCAIINPKGVVEAQNRTNSEEMVIHSCDFSQLKLQREAFPVHKYWSK